MTDKEKMKEILKEMQITSEEMADKLGLTVGSYHTLTAPSSKSTPKWVTAFVEAWKLSGGDLLCVDCGVRTNGFGIEYKFCEECSNHD